ncbi:MAG: GNAT family N-acetyltransferase [Longimicrobiales bacterium]
MSEGVRPLAAGDLPQLVQLCREHAQFERASWTEYDREPALESLFLGSGEGRCWVVEARGGLVGFASSSRELSTWDAAHYQHLDCLYLRGAFRNRGLGRALLAEVAQDALESKAINVQWQTPMWNTAAAGFYGRLGATPSQKLRFTLEPAGCERLIGANDRGAAVR